MKFFEALWRAATKARKFLPLPIVMKYLFVLVGFTSKCPFVSEESKVALSALFVR